LDYQRRLTLIGIGAFFIQKKLLEECGMAVINQVKLDRIIDLLEKINFGSLTIVIHEGKITQLDVNEKHRFQKQ
jgi:hypothetical protein